MKFIFYFALVCFTVLSGCAKHQRIYTDITQSQFFHLQETDYVKFYKSSVTAPVSKNKQIKIDGSSNYYQLLYDPANKILFAACLNEDKNLILSDLNIDGYSGDIVFFGNTHHRESYRNKAYREYCKRTGLSCADPHSNRNDNYENYIKYLLEAKGFLHIKDCNSIGFICEIEDSIKKYEHAKGRYRKIDIEILDYNDAIRLYNSALNNKDSSLLAGLKTNIPEGMVDLQKFESVLNSETNLESVLELGKIAEKIGGKFTASVERRQKQLTFEKEYLHAVNASLPEQMDFLKKYADYVSGDNCYTVSASTLIIRSKPSRSAKKVGSYTHGDKINRIGEKGGWFKTDKGWVSGKYLSKTHGYDYKAKISKVDNIVRKRILGSDSLSMVKAYLKLQPNDSGASARLAELYIVQGTFSGYMNSFMISKDRNLLEKAYASIVKSNQVEKTDQKLVQLFYSETVKNISDLPDFNRVLSKTDGYDKSIFEKQFYDLDGEILGTKNLKGAKFINGRIWEDQPQNKRINYMSFAEAKAYCENMDLLGVKGWRLPSILEFKKLGTDMQMLEYKAKRSNYFTFYFSRDTGCSENNLISKISSAECVKGADLETNKTPYFTKMKKQQNAC